MSVQKYPVHSPYFVLPQSDDFDPGSASLAHSRTLVLLRKVLGGPIFDIEAVWEEHTYFEFEVRSVAKTMGTMVVGIIFLHTSSVPDVLYQAEPYVNHVPTVTFLLVLLFFHSYTFTDDRWRRTESPHGILQGSLHLRVCSFILSRNASLTVIPL